MHDLGPAARELSRVAAHLADDDLDRPTPCEDWSVRVLIGHLLGLSAHFAGVARHEAASRGGPPVDLPDDWRALLDARLADLAAAWREPGAWEGDGEAGGVAMPNADLGVVALEELVLHGWDLATAVGTDFTVAEDDIVPVAGFVAGFEHASVEQRTGLYGPVVPAAAGGFDRVLALAGRDPHRPPATVAG